MSGHPGGTPPLLLRPTPSIPITLPGPFPGPSAPSRAGRSRGGPGPAVGRAPGLPKCVMAGPSPPPPPAARWPAPGGRRRLRALRDCGAEGSGGSSAPLLACSYQKQALGNNFFPFSYSFPPPVPFPVTSWLLSCLGRNQLACTRIFCSPQVNKYQEWLCNWWTLIFAFLVCSLAPTLISLAVMSHRITTLTVAGYPCPVPLQPQKPFP